MIKLNESRKSAELIDRVLDDHKKEIDKIIPVGDLNLISEIKNRFSKTLEKTLQAIVDNLNQTCTISDLKQKELNIKFQTKSISLHSKLTEYQFENYINSKKEEHIRNLYRFTRIMKYENNALKMQPIEDPATEIQPTEISYSYIRRENGKRQKIEKISQVI
ncbi:MAG: hypothetical protein EOP34_07905 [Rickettsiales bacterium]|nr:MAG: hypothetical protein EOP34_07905 [Rickettsiales bacterium]